MDTFFSSLAFVLNSNRRCDLCGKEECFIFQISSEGLYAYGNGQLFCSSCYDKVDKAMEQAEAEEYNWELVNTGGFICYKHQDCIDFVPQLAELLNNHPKRPEHFKGKWIFFDKYIKPGYYWPYILETEATQRKLFLLVISENTFANIWDEDDWIRQEIAIALQFGSKILPICLENGRVPLKKELPEDVCKIADIQFLSANSSDVVNLADMLMELILNP